MAFEMMGKHFAKVEKCFLKDFLTIGFHCGAITFIPELNKQV